MTLEEVLGSVGLSGEAYVQSEQELVAELALTFESREGKAILRALEKRELEAKTAMQQLVKLARARIEARHAQPAPST